MDHTNLPATNTFNPQCNDHTCLTDSPGKGKKVKRFIYIHIALNYETKLISKVLRVAHVKQNTQIYCHLHVYPPMEWAILPLLPATEHHRTLAGTHYRPTEVRRLSWLVTYHGGMPTWRRSPIPVQNDWQCGSRGSNSRPLSRKSDAITTRLPSHRTSPYSFSIPLRVEGWVGLCGWLHIKTVCPCMVTHPSASRIQCRVTLLMSSKPVVPC